MNAASQRNSDLIWDLDAFSQRQRAIDFVMEFENKLCVYSNSVEQLYTNYNLFFPRELDRKLVVLPNPHAHHDTYNGIPEQAVAPTGVQIVPGEMVGKGGSLLRIPLKGSGGKVRYRNVPLMSGLRLINERRPDDKPLLPVLMKGDLREFDAKLPYLHLHSVMLNRLNDLSTMERQSIRRVVLERAALIG